MLMSVFPQKTKSPEMSGYLQRIALSLALASLGASGLVGCAQLRNSKHNVKDCSATICQPSDPIPNQTLRVIKFDSRQPVQLTEVAESIYGWPISNATLKEVRDLTFEECLRLASDGAPIAQQIESHRQWLQSLGKLPQALDSAFCSQANYERSVHAATALEAYLNLTEVYSQQPIIDQTHTVLRDAEGALSKFRDAGVDVPGDSSELFRQHLELDQQVAELRFNQGRLNDGLETLLQLKHESTLPIWTAFVATAHDSISTEEELAVSIALSNRGDLLALEKLAANACCLSPESIAGIAGSANPLLGAGLSLPGPAKWWQCMLRDEIECLKNSAATERQKQLQSLVLAKRDQIRLEVQEALHSLRRHRELLDIKQQQLQSLCEAETAATLAKDERPIDFEKHLEQSIEQLRHTSEIVHEILAIEKDYIRLQNAQGTLLPSY